MEKALDEAWNQASAAKEVLWAMEARASKAVVEVVESFKTGGE